MAIPAIGSISTSLPAGRSAVVVDARPIGEPKDGRQLVALTVKTSERRASEAGVPVAGASRPVAVEPSRAPTSSVLDRDRPGAADGGRDYGDLSQEERAVVDRLRQRDAQVRQEETAHAGAAGDLAGPISYVYQRGPDGRLYAVGGSVPIKAQAVSGDPAEVQRIGARLAAAAHAATTPSGADLAAARRGYQLQAEPIIQSAPAGTGIDIRA